MGCVRKPSVSQVSSIDYLVVWARKAGSLVRKNSTKLARRLTADGAEAVPKSNSFLRQNQTNLLDILFKSNNNR